MAMVLLCDLVRRDLSRSNPFQQGRFLLIRQLALADSLLDRIVEIFGPEASGKTTLALHVIAQSQKKGGICAFIDAEHALDPIYASNIGININDLIVSQPDYGEQALDIAEMLIRSGAVDIIVIDSVAALCQRLSLKVIWAILMLGCKLDLCLRL